MKKILLLISFNSLLNNQTFSQNCAGNPQWCTDGNTLSLTSALGGDNNNQFPLIFQTFGIRRATIIGTGNGNFGIGKFLPVYRLDVASHITIDTLIIYPTTANNYIGCYMIGDTTVLHNKGIRNVFTGYLSGVTISSGYDNTFNGFSSGKLNTTGSGNTLVGNEAASVNTTGNGNTIMGTLAGNGNTDKDSNVYIGARASINNNGSNNVVIGSSAGARNLTTATYSNNCFTGYQSAFNNQNGTDNAFYGYKSGWENNGGNRNTYIGSYAGY